MNQRDDMARLMLLVENAGKPIVEADYPKPYDSTKPNKEEPGEEEPDKEITPTAQDTVKKIKRRDFLKKARDVTGAALNPDALAHMAQLAIGSEPTPAPAQPVQPPIPPVAVRLANVVKKYEYERADWKALLKIAIKRGDFPASTYDPDEPDIDSAAYQDWWESEGSFYRGSNSDHEDILDAFSDMADAAEGPDGQKYFNARDWASVDTAVRDEINAELINLDAAKGEGSDWSEYTGDYPSASHDERSKKNAERIQAEGPGVAGEAHVSYVHIPGVTDPEIIAQNIKNALKPPPGNWWHGWTKWQKEKADEFKSARQNAIARGEDKMEVDGETLNVKDWDDAGNHIGFSQWDEGKVLNLSNVVESILEADYPVPYDSTKPGKEVAPTAQNTVKKIKRRDFLKKARDLAGGVVTGVGPELAQVAARVGADIATKARPGPEKLPAEPEKITGPTTFDTRKPFKFGKYEMPPKNLSMAFRMGYDIYGDREWRISSGGVMIYTNSEEAPYGTDLEEEISTRFEQATGGLLTAHGSESGMQDVDYDVPYMDRHGPNAKVFSHKLDTDIETTMKFEKLITQDYDWEHHDSYMQEVITVLAVELKEMPDVKVTVEGYSLGFQNPEEGVEWEVEVDLGPLESTQYGADWDDEEFVYPHYEESIELNHIKKLAGVEQ